MYILSAIYFNNKEKEKREDIHKKTRDVTDIKRRRQINRQDK
jgi:hypothetical protein